MFVLTLIFYFKSKSRRNLVAKVVTEPEFLVAKEKMLVALVTILVAILSSAKAAFIMSTVRGVGGGGQRIFFKWAKFVKISLISYTTTTPQPPLLTKRKNWHPTVVVVNVYRLKSNQLYNKNTSLL